MAITGKLFGQELQRHKTSQLGVFGFVDNTHSSLTDLLADAVMQDSAADEGRTAGMRERALRIRDEEHRAVCIWGFGGGILETASWLRGLEQFFMDLAGEPDLACAIMDRVLEWKLAYYEHVLSKVGDLVDVFFEGDDQGTQHRGAAEFGEHFCRNSGRMKRRSVTRRS